MKQLAAFLAFAIALALLSSPALAQTIENYNIKANLTLTGSVEHEIIFEFPENITSFSFDAKAPVSNLTSEGSYNFTDCAASGNVINCDLIGPTGSDAVIKLYFGTENTIREEGNNLRFVYDYGVPQEIKKAFIFVRIPKGSTLGTDVVTESFFPQTGQTTLTEGKRIAVFWELDKVTPEDRLKFSVLYTQPPIDTLSDFLVVIVVIVAAALGIAGISLYLSLKGRRKSAELITSVLNPDENRIVEILKAREGKALQKVLVRETDFSKAKVSRIVKELKSRKVVEIDPVSGRENRIILRLGPEKPKTEAKEEGE